MIVDQLSHRRPPLEPVLPLINVVFLLLVFFMLAGQLATQPVVDVLAPESETTQGDERPDLPLLILNREGQWFVEDSDQPINNSALAQLVDDHSNEQPLRVLAADDISVERLREHLLQLRSLGVEQVRLVTRVGQQQ